MSGSQISFGAREWRVAYRAALGVLRVPDQAEDAAQDALLRAYVARDSFRGHSRPEGWLHRIAHNTAISHLRRPHRRNHSAADPDSVLDQHTAGARPGPDSSARAAQLARALQACLDRLVGADRIAFTERFLLGTSEKELAEILGISKNAAKQRAFRARRRVRAQLGQPDD